MMTVLANGALATGLTIQILTQPLVPPEPLPLGGYTDRGNHKSTLGQELFARIAVITEGPNAVAIVAFEGLTIPESLHREVQRRIDIPVFLVATHTHSAPDTQMLNERMTFSIPGIAGYRAQWLDWYAVRIAGGIAKTQQSPKRTWQPYGGQTISDLARSRRPGVALNNVVTQLSHQFGEPVVTVVGAHATCLSSKNLATHGDWPGVVMRSQPGLILPGAIGNASPNADGPNAMDSMRDRLAKLKFQTTPLAATLRVETEPILLEKPLPHPEFARANKVNDAIAQLVINRFAPTKAKLTAIKIGDLVLLGVPGEPSSEIETEIISIAKRNLIKVAVTSHTNGWIGYILSPRDYDRGGYEATLSFHGRHAGTRVIECAERLIRRISRAKAEG